MKTRLTFFYLFLLALPAWADPTITIVGSGAYTIPATAPLTEATAKTLLVGGVATAENKASVAVTTTSGTALAANASRLNATVVNYGATGCFITCGATAVSGQGVYLAAGGGSYSIDAHNLYRGIITAITTSGSTTLAIHEGY